MARPTATRRPAETLYLATLLAGLEPVAADELATKVPSSTLRETLRGKLLFTALGGPEPLLALRTVDNVYAVAGRFSVGPHRMHLAELTAAVAALDIGAAAREVMDEGQRRRPTAFVNASRAGKHTYSRFELAEAALRGVLAAQPEWRAGTPDRHDVELRIDVAGQDAILAVRLTPPEFRFRGAGRQFAPAALRPPVAHALVWLTRPQADEAFLDPFCGSGTILVERLVYPVRRAFGGDLSAEALHAARENLPPVSSALLAQWDARRLPLASGAIDSLAANLPFGHQVLRPEEIAGLYTASMPELRRVLDPAGRAIVLTDQVEALERAAESGGLHVERLLTLSLRGLHPSVFRLTREPAQRVR